MVNYPVLLMLTSKWMLSRKLIVKLEKGENNPGPNVDDFNDIIFLIRSTFKEEFNERFRYIF